MEKYPIYRIENFKRDSLKTNLYVNTFKNHLINNSFIESSHSHNFYMLVLFTNGAGEHKIDFNSFQIKRGSMYVLQPGQVHGWKLSKDIEGYIVFYSEELYNLYFGSKRIQDYPFYKSAKNISEVQFNETELLDVEVYFKLLIKENLLNNSSKTDKLLNILDIIHIEISRKQLRENNNQVRSYNQKIQDFNAILNTFYKVEKSPSFYAEKMNITLKHLNRISKLVLNKTVTELIREKLILESKRMLTFSDNSISEIADDLGYDNYSYFAKVFKKQTNTTPSMFRSKLNIENW